ncbi:2-hydroxyacid dehydrogenase [Jatrophihabitans sp.]|uniref:2-hydroxyacid dehydrogenase n=1 Tax=Jatrophihabitans sp. TaxID=1932789 RepID=UPI002F21E3E5
MEGKVLVTGSSVDDELLEPLRQAGLTVSNPKHLLTEPELRQELASAVAYLLGGEEYATANAISDAGSLRVIAFLGVGYESFIDAPSASRRGIRVTNTPGTLTNSVSEFTVGLILNATRRITQYVNSYRRGERGTEEKQRDLESMTVGIIGLGNLGTQIARLVGSFGSELLYYSRTRKPDLESELGLRFCSLVELVESSDVIVVMTPGNETTHGMLNSSVLSRARPGSILINTARREVVDPAALREGLKSGAISVAAYDDFYEGEIGSELLRDFSDDRLLVTGHIASLTSNARDGMARMAVQSILNILADGKDEHIVNRDDLIN